MKRTITRAEYFQLLGLKTLFEHHALQEDHIEAAAKTVLEIRKEDQVQGNGSGEADGYVAEALWRGGSLATLFERIGVEVEGGIPA